MINDLYICQFKPHFKANFYVNFQAPKKCKPKNIVYMLNE